MGRFVPMPNTMAQHAPNGMLEAVHEFPLSFLPALSAVIHKLFLTLLMLSFQ